MKVSIPVNYQQIVTVLKNPSAEHRPAVYLPGDRGGHRGAGARGGMGG